MKLTRRKFLICLLALLTWATPAIAEVVYTTIANVFTNDQQLRRASGINLSFSDATTIFGYLGSQLPIMGSGTNDTMLVTSANGKNLILRSPSSQTIQVYNGATLTATIDTSIKAVTGYYERSRTAAMGEWTSVAYNSANFTADSGTWTVDSADQVSYAYTLVGKTMTVVFSIQNTDVSAAAGELRIAIPGGFSAAREFRLVGAQVVDAGGAATIGLVVVSATGTIIRVFKDQTGAAYTITAADNTAVRGTIVFEVS